MRVQTEEWQRFIPGVRMHKGKKTLFYNGEKLLAGLVVEENNVYLVYDEEERRSWEVIIVLPRVEIIPVCTFYLCDKVETVLMSDSVKRIEQAAFDCCDKLQFITFSRNLEYIGKWAFNECWSLTSIFIPPSCREVGEEAFWHCEKLAILSVSQQTQLGALVIRNSPLEEECPIEMDEEINQWIKDVNMGNEFDLHRECASCNPSEEAIYAILMERGLQSFTLENKIGITPSRYLQENPFSQVKEQKLINRLVLELMGEIIA